MPQAGGDYDELNEALKQVRKFNKQAFIEVKAAIGAKENLRRPATTLKNKKNFMEYWLIERGSLRFSPRLSSAPPGRIR